MTRPEQKLPFNDFLEQADWLSRQLVVAMWSERLRWSGLEIIDDELMTRTRSTEIHGEFNNILLTRIRQTTFDADLDRCLEILAAEAKPTRWFLSKQNAESEITEQLIARGFDECSSFAIVATDLNAEKNLQWRSIGNAEGGAVTKIDNALELKQYANILARTYDFSTSFANSWFDMLLSCGVGPHLPWRYYLYRVNGLPVGMLGALWTDQVVAIEVMSVLPEYRKRRIGSALVYAALFDAQQAGYEVAVAYPTSSAQGLYRRYGFTDVGGIDCVTIGSDLASRDVYHKRTDPPVILDALQSMAAK